METPALLPGIEPGSTLLLVHAHPDDESIVTGALMAGSVAAGVNVVLVTCTRGELGEVIVPELAHLEVAQTEYSEDTPDAGHSPDELTGLGAGLALERERELAAALGALGVQQHIWLGQGLTAPADGPVTFRDSGMRWGPNGRAVAASTVLPGSFSRAPLPDTAALLAAAIRALQPAVVVTYAADGGYGHPDHVRAHELTMAALRQAAGQGTAAEPESGAGMPLVYTIVSDRPDRPLAEGVPRLAIKGHLDAKTAAMAAHRTQLTIDGRRFALSDNVWKDIPDVEEFVAVEPLDIYGTP